MTEDIKKIFKKQGYSAVRIRDELRKMGVPPALINEVV
jgi:AcrR family transcriptional regulator